MKYLVSNREEEYEYLKSDTFKLTDLNEFKKWIKDKNIFQLDTETLFIDDSANVVEDRKLILIQIGDINKEDQWLIEHTAFLTEEWIEFLTWYFQNINNSFICHNAFFEYTVIKANLGIRVENIEDTFLMSKVLNTGLDLAPGYHSLAGCLLRFFDIEIGKEEQTTFTFDILTENQLVYASNDVLYLYDLFVKLKELLEEWDLWFIYSRVEREVIKAYADMGMNDMKFDVKHWMTMINTLKIDDAAIEEDLNMILMSDSKLVNYLKSSNKVLGTALVQPKDQIVLNWGSNVVRKTVLRKIIPDLISVDRFTKPELKKLYKAKVLTNKENKLLNLYLERDFTTLNRYIRTYYKDWLYDNNYFLKKDDILINWSSNVHKLFIFQFYYPNLENTNAKTLNRIFANPLINKYKKYVKVHKSVTTYGENFIKKYVSRHNTIVPRGCRSILNTGRIAYGILLQLPSEARFRNAILPLQDDWVFVDSDWSSAELLIAAYVSGETAFTDAAKAGKDLHSMSAEKLFKNKWIKIAEDDCEHLKSGKKCNCESHAALRTMSKTITFGILFGSTHVGLSERLNISRTEAMQLVETYFETFPKLKAFFDNSAEEGMRDNRVTSLKPTKRVRFFHPPLHDGEKQAIGRASKNFKIQETNASMLKIALIKLRKYILEHDFPARLNLPVHDEILSSCHEDVKDHWLMIQELAMQEAADMYIEPGLLGTDSTILTKWTK